jgi:hypothetical protein
MLAAVVGTPNQQVLDPSDHRMAEHDAQTHQSSSSVVMEWLNIVSLLTAPAGTPNQQVFEPSGHRMA